MSTFYNSFRLDSYNIHSDSDTNRLSSKSEDGMQLILLRDMVTLFSCVNQSRGALGTSSYNHIQTLFMPPMAGG